MGGLEVSNKSLRCDKCLEIRRITIVPEYPEPRLIMECRCGEKESKLFDFVTEFKKKDNFKIKCAKCQNENPKEPKYCYKCQKIYCVKCLDFHSQLSSINIDEEEGENKNNELMSSIGHKTIDIDKVDFNCILHENEMFTGFCKKCLLHFCQKCQEENLHKDHEISLFSEIILDKQKRDIIKGCINLSHEKIDHNEKVCKKLKKKIKNEENKNQLTNLIKENKKINEKILEHIDAMFDIYDKVKHKNYSIIFNARKNTKFNIDKIVFEKKDNEEEDAVTFINYLKNDFILQTEYSIRRKSLKKQKKMLENEEKQNNMHSINNIEDNFRKNSYNEESNKKHKGSDNIIEIKEDKKDKNEIKEEKKEEDKKAEDKKEESKKEKKEKEKENKEKEEKVRKEKEKKDKEKKDKEEKARKEKEDKEKAKKEKKDDKKAEKKENKIQHQPITKADTNSFGEKAAQLSKMMKAKGGVMLGRPGSLPIKENTQIKIEKSEGNTVDLLNNIKVSKVNKKKPKKVNF